MRNVTTIICRDRSMTPGTTDVTMADEYGDPDGRTERGKDERELTDEEAEAFRREHVFASDDKATAEEFPRMFNVSAGFIYHAVVRAEVPDQPEYVTITLPEPRSEEQSVALHNAVAQWNLLWEAAQFRRRFFDEDDLPPQLARIAGRGDVNVVFVPRSGSRYHQYAPLYHLLPGGTLERFGLPLLGAGQWPFIARVADIDSYLPADFERRLAQAWASTVWRHLMPASPIRAFSRDEPIRLLAHNLDFWLPPVTQVMQDILRALPVADHGIEEGPALLIDGSELSGAVRANPRMARIFGAARPPRPRCSLGRSTRRTPTAGCAGSWMQYVPTASRTTSPHGSYAKEDFERKLYRKRNKIKVHFVELTDTIPVQSPETEVEDAIVYADFLALLDERDRQVVVLLNSGTTKLADIADILGYANHSAVSKRLKRIREQAKRYFDQT